jgi:hypothetical protein
VGSGRSRANHFHRILGRFGHSSLRGQGISECPLSKTPDRANAQPGGLPDLERRDSALLHPIEHANSGRKVNLHCSLGITRERYILFISLKHLEMVMVEPSIRKPTKKGFHFPTNANGDAKGADRPADGENGPAAADALPVPTKVAKQRRPATAGTPQAAAAVEVKAKRVKKEKVVRDSFTMPKSDYEKLTALKQKCLDAGVSVKKSELLRAGLLLLDSAPPKRLIEAISVVESVKTGRPAKL